MMTDFKVGRRIGVSDPALRGYHAIYRLQEKNFCPGCGHSQWWVGRSSAECVICGTALPFSDSTTAGSGETRWG